MTKFSNEDAIKKQVSLLREGYSIGVYPEYIPLMCNECDSENLKFSVVNDLGYEQISLTRLGISEPFHRASLIGFNSDNGPEWFIVDPTYGQFFENETFKNYMFDNYEEFSNKLLKQGYIECTLSNILSYINGFALSNAYVSDVDVDKVYQNVEDLLLSNVIVDREVFENETRLVELLQMRVDSLKQSLEDNNKVIK